MTKKTTKKALVASLLSLLLCFSMLIGTTFAWFTDSVTSANNIIQSGTLKVGMNWAEGNEDPASADWKDASKGAMFNNTLWEPGYVEAKHIQVNNIGSLALNWEIRIVANGVVSDLADVIDVYYFADAKQLQRADVTGGTYLGTLTDVLGAFNTESNDNIGLPKTARGSLEAGKSDDFTIAFKMQESAGNEYQGLAIGTDFSVELIATQQSYEKDSFDEKYDEIVPSPELPAALVRPLDNLTIDTTGSKMGSDLGEFELDAGYQFQPTESLVDSNKSEYRHWHPDFVVSADRDVPTDSIVLAGYYDAWCSLNNDKWVAFVNDAAVAAGDEVRLVSNIACVTYKDLCDYGNDGIGFLCGIAAADDKAAELLAGTTVTVDLRLYETEGEWSDSSHICDEIDNGNYVVAGTFTYTFPKVVNSQAELDAAVANGGTVTIATPGTYTVPATVANKTVTIEGNGADTVIDFTKVNTAANANITFKNLHFQGKNENIMNGFGIQGTSGHIAYENCTFDGAVTNEYFGSVSYKNCTFTGTGYITTYAVKSATFENCVFDKADSRAVLVYSHGDNPCEVTLTDCTFKAAAKATTWNGDWTSAIEIDTTNIPTEGTSVTIENCTFDANYSGLYRDKSAAGKANAVIVVK